MTDQANGQIQMWLDGNINSTITISENSSFAYGIFVTTTGDIYVDNSNQTGQVEKWTSNATIGIPVMYVNYRCYGIFIDIGNSLYCSAGDLHYVVRTSLSDSAMTVTAVAGVASVNGSASNRLNNPRGIFVDINFDLYVADCGNNRIQLFRLGGFNALTVAGRGASGNITLSCPTGVALNADNYLFIVDSQNHRIVASGPSGFRCLVGCSGGGSASSQLYYPISMAFDGDGDLFVTDPNNNRIQKFVFDSDSCGKNDSI